MIDKSYRDTPFACALQSSLASNEANGGHWVWLLESEFKQKQPNIPRPYSCVTYPAARLMLVALGCGMRLRIPHDLSQASLIEGSPQYWNRPAVLIPQQHQAAVLELAASELLHKMHRETIDGRVGWQEAGLDGRDCDLFSLKM